MLVIYEYHTVAWLLVPNKCRRACDMRWLDAGHFFHRSCGINRLYIGLYLA